MSVYTVIFASSLNVLQNTESKFLYLTLLKYKERVLNQVLIYLQHIFLSRFGNRMMLFSCKQYLSSFHRLLHCITFKTKISLGLGLKCNAFFFFHIYLSAQELASQDEKLLLMESSLKATQEQLSEQIAETVHQEQNSRKSQTELKTLREHIITSEEEISDYK